MVLETMLRRLSGTEQFRFEHGHRMELGTQKKKWYAQTFVEWEFQVQKRKPYILAGNKLEKMEHADSNACQVLPNRCCISRHGILHVFKLEIFQESVPGPFLRRLSKPFISKSHEIPES